MENKQQLYSAHFVHILLHAEFSAMDNTLNIVSKCRFLYLNIHGLQKGAGKFFMGVLESPGKVLDFFASKRVHGNHVLRTDCITVTVQMVPSASVQDTALLEWISEYTVPAYTTADSAVSYLNHARIA